MTSTYTTRPAHFPARQLIGGLAVAGLAASAWYAWLGWDNQYQFDPVTQTSSGPYEAWQVIGCVLSLLAVLVGALLLNIRPAVAAPAMTLAFTAAWTATAAAHATDGLYVVGAVLLGVGMAFATTVISLIVTVLRRRSTPQPEA